MQPGALRLSQSQAWVNAERGRDAMRDSIQVVSTDGYETFHDEFDNLEHALNTSRRSSRARPTRRCW